MTTQPAPTGWYEAPGDPDSLRFWDGAAWTEHYAPHPLAEVRRKAAQKAALKTQKADAKLQKKAARSETAARHEEQRLAEVEILKQTAAEQDRAEAERKAEEAEAKREKRAQKEQEAEERRQQIEAERNYVLSGAVHIGPKLSEPALKAIVSHRLHDELAWFVIHSTGSGVLVGFKNRVMLFKVGAFTAFAAGSMGGGRITSFSLAEITGIEYNSGLRTGVLEILTPSYQGTKNQDFWKGARSSLNSDSSNPMTLSNTMPLSRPEYEAALPVLNLLRARIDEAKHPQIQVVAPTTREATSLEGTPMVGLTDELAKLAALRDQGVIDEGEFATLKRSIIARSVLPTSGSQVAE